MALKLWPRNRLGLGQVTEVAWCLSDQLASTELPDGLLSTFLRPLLSVEACSIRTSPHVAYNALGYQT